MALGARPYVKLIKSVSDLCAVTNITEISLHVTFSNQSHSYSEDYFLICTRGGGLCI